MNIPFTPAELAGIKGRNCRDLYEVEHVILNILKQQVKRERRMNATRQVDGDQFTSEAYRAVTKNYDTIERLIKDGERLFAFRAMVHQVAEAALLASTIAPAPPSESAPPPQNP